MAVLGAGLGEPITALRGGVRLLMAGLPKKEVNTRMRDLVARMQALLPEAIEVSDAAVDAAKRLAGNETYFRPVRDLSDAQDDPTRAADYVLDRGVCVPTEAEAPLRHFDKRERAMVRRLLIAFLSALRDDAAIVREVRVGIQRLTLSEVRDLMATVEGQSETVAAILRRWLVQEVLYHPAAELDRSVRPGDIQPSHLLDARYEVVPFQGREAELETIRAFRESDEEISARVIEGAGGLGKTRLAMEAVRQAREGGWEQSGFLKPGVTGEALRTALLELSVTGQPTFVVADYGEDGPEQVAELMAAWLDVPDGGPKRRLLVLARHRELMDERLKQVKQTASLLGPAADYLQSRMQPLFLKGVLLVQADARPAVFREAQRRFAGRLGLPLEKLTDPPDTLTSETKEYEHLKLPLYLHMSAYASLFGRPSVRKVDLLTEILEWNWRYVERLLNDEPALSPLHISQSHLHEVLTVATLTLAARPPTDGTVPDARACLAPTTLGRKAEKEIVTDEVVAFLTKVFGYGGPDGSRVFDALRPDALGEGLVFATLSQKPTLLDVVLGFDAASQWSACGVLVRSALALAEAPAKWLDELLTAERLDTSPDISIALISSIPSETVELMVLAATLTERSVNGLEPDDEDGMPIRAALLAVLGIRLSDIGRSGDALAVTHEAVELYRRLNERTPDAFEPALAANLSMLGIRLSEVGRYQDALAAETEATAVRRRLAEHAPDGFEPGLEASLSNLGNRLSEVGRRNDALAVTDEAVELYRRLSKRTPDAFEPGLAGSLSNLGKRLSEVGRYQDALTAESEAFAIRRRLAERAPDAFEPHLARSLSHLGSRLSEVGRRDDALKVAQEAVGLFRRLDARTPDAFKHDLAVSLGNLGNRLSEVGRRDDALEVTQEAVELYRRLADRTPDAFEPGLARSLSNLGNRLSATGQCDDALAVTEEAVGLYRRLVEHIPDAFEPGLAGSLANLGKRLSQVGRHDEALAVTDEAVELYRRLDGRTPDAFEPRLAASLNNLGERLSAVDRRNDALAATEEAVGLYRRLSKRMPDAFEPGLAWSLSNLGNCQMEAEDPRAAVTSYAKSLRLLTGFVQVHPKAFRGPTITTILDYLTASEAVETEPDASLLMPLFAALEIALPGAEGE